MATETENYSNKGLATAAKTRGAQRHIDGWRPISTDFNPDGTVTITWNNDSPPPPTADEIKIKDLKDKLKDDSMTHKELLELLRLTGVID